MPWMSIPVALAITGAASGAAEIYGQHAAASTNTASLAAQTAADQRAAQLQEAQLAEQKAEFEARQQADQSRWDDYIKVNTPYWQAGAGVLQHLYGLAGLGSAPALPMPSVGSTPPAAPTGQPVAAANGSSAVPIAMPMTAARVAPAAASSTNPVQALQSLSNLMAMAKQIKGTPTLIGDPVSGAPLA